MVFQAGFYHVAWLSASATPWPLGRARIVFSEIKRLSLQSGEAIAFN